LDLIGGAPPAWRKMDSNRRYPAKETTLCGLPPFDPPQFAFHNRNRLLRQGPMVRIHPPPGQLPDPNGLCFSPDYKTLYVISTGQGPGDTGPGGKREVYAFDMQGTKATNMRLFTDMMLDGIKCGPDGMRADTVVAKGRRSGASPSQS
jgi:hypothetical protein